MASMDRLDEVKRGDEAKRVLDNPAYQNAFAAIKDSIVMAMTQSAMGDEKTHSRLVLSLQLLNQIEKRLQDQMMTGKMASMQMDNTITEKIRRII